MRKSAIFRELITIFALEVKLSCMKLNRIKTVLVEKICPKQNWQMSWE